MEKKAGKAFVASAGAVIIWQLLGEDKRRNIGHFIERLLGGLWQMPLPQQPQEMLPPPTVEANIEVPTAQWPGLMEPMDIDGILNWLRDFGSNAEPAAMSFIPEKDSLWRRLILHPSVVLILGKRGSGKSALGYRLLELLRFVAAPYVVGAPSGARGLVPEWIGMVSSLEELPMHSIALVDEAYIMFHARNSMASGAKAMSNLLNLSRQRDQTLIFVSQESRQVDLNVSSSANVVIFKDLGLLQLEFERRELSKLAYQARESLKTVQGDVRRWSYVYSPDADFVGLQESEMPTFWKPSLSKAFGEGTGSKSVRKPDTMTPQMKAQMARKMRDEGSTYSEIALALGVSKATVVNYLKGYPYGPKRDRRR